MANAAVVHCRLGGRARLAAPLGGPAGTDMAGDAILRNLEAGECRLLRRGADRGRAFADLGNPRPMPAASVRSSIIATTRWPKRAARIPPRLSRERGRHSDRQPFSGILTRDRAGCEKDRQDRPDGRRRPDAADRRAAQRLLSHCLFLAWTCATPPQMAEFTAGLDAVAKRTRALLAVTDGANGSWWHDGHARSAMSPRIPFARSIRSAPATFFMAPVCWRSRRAVASRRHCASPPPRPRSNARALAGSTAPHTPGGRGFPGRGQIRRIVLK